MECVVDTCLCVQQRQCSCPSLMYLVNSTGTLRVSEEGELYGFDLHEHGISAYPEYAISSKAAPGYA